MIHCDTVTILSCVSFKVDSFALRASSENDIVTTTGHNYVITSSYADSNVSELHCAHGMEIRSSRVQLELQ